MNLMSKKSLVSLSKKLLFFKFCHFKFLSLVSQNRGKFQGVCIWFECTFPSSETSMIDPICLSTSPKEPPTHWKQTVIAFPEDATEEIDEDGIPIAVQLKITRSADSTRRYNLQLEILDAEKEEHAMPCDCILTKCILTKQHLRSLEMEEIDMNGK